MHRPARQDRIKLHACKVLCARLYFGQKRGDDIDQRHFLAQKLARFVGQWRAQHAFQRAHKPPLLAHAHGLCRGAADQKRFAVWIDENGAWQGIKAGFQRYRKGAPARQNARGGV